MTKRIFPRLLGRLFVLSWCAVVLLLAPQPVQAQPTAGPDPAEQFSREELAQLLAPIALFPDPLLAQILMASTYPIEVIEADRWLKKHPELSGDALDQALLEQSWDPSVKSLCHFPTVLARMSEHIAETTDLGNAFLAQETEVMDMVQELRAKAYAEGNLGTTAEQQVVVRQEIIYIEPVNRRVIYVPYYDPFYVYGPWWYPAYPPYYWGPVGVHLGFGIFFWPGIYFSFSFGDWCYFDWHHHYVYVDSYKRPRYVHHDYWVQRTGPWQHAPDHRKGVAYRDKYTAGKYGQAIHRPSDLWRDHRGFPERPDVSRDQPRAAEQSGRVDRDRRDADSFRVDRARQEQQRIEQGLKNRGQQQRATVPRDQNNLERSRQEQPERAMSGRNTMEPQRIEQELKSRRQTQRAPASKEQNKLERSGLESSERVLSGREPQARPRLDSGQGRQRPEQAGQVRERIERERQQRSQDNIFNPVDGGRRERQSSERGHFSRQQRGGEFRDQGRAGGDQRQNPGRGWH